MSNWLDIGALEKIPVRGARVVKTVQGCIAVFRPTETTAFALEDRCPHKAGPLSQGIVHGNSVTCPLHNWVISLETGLAQGADEGATRKVPLRLSEGRIQLDLATFTIPAAA